MLHEFTQRVSGKATSKARHGTITDLALHTLQEDVRVMVIATDKIFKNTPDEELFGSVVPALVQGECKKSRIVCAILHKDHFDLGVLRTTDSVQAVFQAGPEWDSALGQLLSFVKAKSPLPRARRGDLGPRWVAPDEKKISKKEHNGGPQVRAGSERVSIGKRVGERKTRSSVLLCGTPHYTPHSNQTTRKRALCVVFEHF